MAKKKDDIVSEAEEILEEAEGKMKGKGAGAADAPAAEAEGAQEAEEAEAAEAEEAVEEARELTPEEALEAAQAEVKEWQDKFMRLHAEWDTYRRRTNEQREEEKTRATEGLVENLLPVIDDFERSIGYADENGEAGLLDGVKQVHAKLVEVLTKNGVEVIDPVGEAFDALAAQAVAKVEDASVPDETVAEVYQKGYRMGRKVIRPAMVTVTTGGPAREEIVTSV
ncbi:MAG: nucleotide exchange factor GrpE [Eggerthellaceae bacterium]|nr:nucleotide exchange factor GrpE [Eggerthellaceae bacterium]MBR1644224.1 nucleotide exchange factor GrpE [Bacteroidales bacterium]